MTRFLQLSLIDTVFLLALGTAAWLYGGHIHTAGIVAVCAVLVVFAAGAGYALLLAYKTAQSPFYVPLPRQIAHLELAVDLCPMIGIAGVASGFLVALSGGTGDVEGRIVGASSGLAATVFAVAAMAVLDIQAHMLRGPSVGCCK